MPHNGLWMQEWASAGRHDATDKEWLALFTADRRLTKSGIQHVYSKDDIFVLAGEYTSCWRLWLSLPAAVHRDGELMVVWWTCYKADRGRKATRGP